MLQISLREANQHFGRYVESVEKGEEVLITRRGKPVAKLSPVTAKNVLSKAQKAAWQRSLARMHKGFDLGGKTFNRESLYDR